MNDYDFWSFRYNQQARWTKPTRDFIVDQISISKASSILEIGCGSSAILNDLQVRSANLFGIDIDYNTLLHNKNKTLTTKVINGDAYFLPIKNNFFDLTFCHYLLLWLSNPVACLHEMSRVTKRTGWICCFAEPDYLSRIDAPQMIEKIGELQNESLIRQGVNLKTGRNLVDWLMSINLTNIHWGIIGSHQNISEKKIPDDHEIEVMLKDFSWLSNSQEVSNLMEEEKKAQKDGNRVLFIPTFYAFGQKP